MRRDMGAAVVAWMMIAVPACSAQGAPAGGALRPYDIGYHIAMSNPPAHLYDVRIDVSGVREDTIKLQMPVWSMGRYARMDFARNVQDFTVTDSSGRALVWDKENGALWRVATRGVGRVTVQYRVYANNLSGTFSVLDPVHANWNGPSLFMYVDGHKPDPVHLTVAPPPGWRVVNGASRTLEQRDFTFVNYDEFVDTPTEVAPAITVDTFRVDNILYRVMVHYNGSDGGQRARFVRDIERLVRYENRIIAPPPIEAYTFLVHIGFPAWDAMEHLQSTQIIDGPSWAPRDTALVGLLSAAHEYFHAWNVKRIRPAALGPFDYTREQYQPSLWVAEGWTNYYGNIAMTRIGLGDAQGFYQNIVYLIGINESPGARAVSARMSSFQAPFFDGTPTAPMDVNQKQTWESYYEMGEARALLLDLIIRDKTDGAKSLDDALRLLKTRTWDAPATSYYLQGRGYTEDDVERAVSDAAGMDMHPWFARYVGGTDALPWAETLALVGLTVTTTRTPEGVRRTVTETPGATARQVRLRTAWLSAGGA